MTGRPSAGSVTLLLQNLLVPLALAPGPSELVLGGGTHVAWSPPAHHVRDVLLPTLAEAGVEARLSIERWGWYPRGGGRIRVTIAGGAEIRGVQLTDRGPLRAVDAETAASNLPRHVVERMAGRFGERLAEGGIPTGKTTVAAVDAGGRSTGAGVFVVARFDRARAGFDALGRRGLPAEEVADDAADRVISHHRQTAVLDEHLPDQLLPFLALAEGPSLLSTMAITQHTLTSAAVIDRFLPSRIEIEGAEGQPGEVRVTGKPR
jgi:RNA 3'-terminal phosphate cyclase (ATP)